MMYENMHFFYCISSLFLIVSLLNWLVLLLKRKTAFRLRLYQYNNRGKFLVFCCICYNLWCIYYLKENFLFDLLILLLISCIFMFLRQKFGYSEAEINSSLKDSKSIGALWAHQTYDAYYKLVLENIKDRMLMFEKKNNIHFFFKQLIIVIPQSCNSEGTLSDKDDSIQEFNHLEPVENDQGANVNRIYKNPVYRIFEDVYIVAEFSSPISTLWKSRFQMDKNKICYIRDCYVKTLKILLKGSPAIIVEYDDGATTLSDCILSSIKREIDCFV